jgi:hypothetical protein
MGTMPTETGIHASGRRVRAGLIATCLALPLALTLPAPASAQTTAATAVAKVRAVASPWMPTIKRLRIQPDESTAVDTLLEKTIGDALARRGITVDPAAPMTLYYDTEISAETVNPAPGINDTELGAPGTDQDLFSPGDFGPVYGENNPNMMLPVPVPQNGQGGAAGQQAQAGGQPYGLSFVIGEPDADPVWSGAIRATMPAQDPEAVARVMTPPLVTAIGRSGRSTILIPLPRVD